MKVIHNELQSIQNEVELYVIGDTHIGSSQFNEPLLLDLIGHILEQDNRYVILNGDIVDCTFKDSKGNVYENEMTPQVALSYASKTLAPLKDRVLCTLGGNHDDDRSMRLVGISFAQQLAVLIGVPDKYSPDSVLLDLAIKDGIQGRKANSNFTIFVNHGNNGGGGTSGSKANSLERMALVFPNADIYIHNHTHFPMTFKDNYAYYESMKRIVTTRERMFVNGNAFMNYFNGYGEKRLYKPQSQSIPVIKLRSKRIQDKREKKDYIMKYMSCEI